MTDYTIPRANAPIAGNDAPTTQWYNFLNFLDSRTSTAAGDVQAEITTIATKLGSPDGTVDNIPPLGNVTSVQGRQSIVSSGISVVQLRLVNDADVVSPIYYYGTDSTGAKGYNLLYSAFASTSNIAKINTAGIVSFDLTNLADSGAGTLLATTFDAKGRKTGSRAATITGTVGRVTVANGDASAGLPTIDLATVTDAGGGTLQKTAFDDYGRKTGTSAATTSDLAEGSNLYFTVARVLATVLTGLSTATSAAITAADSVLIAFGKLQAQITTLTASLTGYVPTSRTISTTAPLTGGGDLSANRTFAIPAATTSVDGYLAHADWATFNAKVPTTTTITAGTGLSGGGDLSANRTLALANTAVTAASYGDATHVATFTVDAQGRLTAASSVAITFPASAVTSVFGRTGAVVAANGDYVFSQIGSLPTTLSGYGITDAALSATTISAGTGLSGGGSLASNRTLSIANTAVTAASYGDTTHVATFTVNAQGQLTLAGSSAIAFPVTSVFGRTGAVVAAANDYTFAQLASKPTTLAGYGITDALATITPAGYIDGMKMIWNSATSISATSGACYIQGSNAVISFPSLLTLSGLSLTASTWYHLYGYLNAGVPAIECVTTAPAAPYSGTARSKTGDTSRRYLGSIRTTSASALIPITHNPCAGQVMYVFNINDSNLFCLNAGTATSLTTVSLASAIPSTAMNVVIFAENTSNVLVFLSNSLVTDLANNTIAFIRQVDQTVNFNLPTDGSQAIQYRLNGTPSSGAAFIWVTGYFYQR